MTLSIRSLGKQSTQAGPPVHSNLRVGPLTNIPSLLREFGRDPEEVLAASGFTVEQFEDTDFVISYMAASRLLARCVEVSGCSWFGLKLGEKCLPSHLGIAGFLVLTAENVEAALKLLGEYLGLHDQGGSLTMNRSADYVVVGYTIHHPGTSVPGQIYDMSNVYICNLMRALCNPRWTPLEVLLSRDTPSDTAPYKRFFQAPVRFNADQNAIVFATRWLSHKSPFSDPFLHGYLQRQARAKQEELHEDMVSHLRYMLNQCIATRNFKIAAVARSMGLHERTLNRRLKSEGTSFRSELDQVRRGMSEQLLSITRMEVRRVAEVLGYSSTSAFNHAFQRWNRDSPEHWRAKHSGD